MSPRSAARRAASRRVSRKAGSPVWRWAVPSPMARSMPRIGSALSELGVEVEGLGVVAEGVGGGEGHERGVGRPARVVEGLGQVDGLGSRTSGGPVRRPATGAIAAEVLQRFGHLPVRPGPAGGTQILVQGVLDEGVGEGVVPGVSASSRTRRRGRRGVEDVEQRRLPMCRVARASTSRSKSRPITAASDNTCSASGPSRPTRAPITTRTLSGKAIVFDRVRGDHRPVASWEIAPVSDEVAEDLAHEERVAVGLPMQRMGETHCRVIEGVPGGGFHERHDAGVVESGQLDARHAVLSMQRRERFEQRMGVRQCTVAIRPRARATASVGRRRSRDASNCRLALSAHCRSSSTSTTGWCCDTMHQQTDHRGEQLVTLGVGIGRLRRPEPRQPGWTSAGINRASSDRARPRGRRAPLRGRGSTIVAERFGEELIRGGEVFFAVPEQHARIAVERGPGRFGDERGLAETGLTRDEEHLAAFAPGDTLERMRHRRQLGFAAHDTRGGAHRPDGQATGRRGPVSSAPRGSQRTSTVGTGSGRPFNVSAPTGLHSWRLRRPAINRTRSAARICPLSQRRAQSRRFDHRIAEVVVVLARRPRPRSARRASPPTCSRPRLSRSMPCCMATAQDNAADDEANTTMSPSPRFFTSVPPASATACRKIAKCRRRSSSAASGVKLDDQRRRTDHVGEQHGHVLGRHRRAVPDFTPHARGSMIAGDTSSDASCAMTARSMSRSSGPGSMPSSSANTVRARW